MLEKKKKVEENINVELGGMGFYGTTSNEEVAGYRASGDIENAGRLDKGFKRPEDEAGAEASVKNHKD
ncbi:hypothetical protein P5G51_016850 [Virgibacillus sp. 179-BFC.A HS]|uniref:DUF4025 domain-containing protein n=1 Tax=Tigheibacillus jepli TaxID=3035914 RepID=A0ABU5CKD4_9BACI|nr:hypothetical protein [Virgibacillus sp. 179-BFC.A HS]MDY0406803.1 hypothetical protein [Virgibacillus sp. 179-BFC.A HS]